MIPLILFYRLSSCERNPLGDVEIAESLLVLLYHFSSALTIKSCSPTRAPSFKNDETNRKKKMSHLLDDNLLFLVYGVVTDHLKIVILML